MRQNYDANGDTVRTDALNPGRPRHFCTFLRATRHLHKTNTHCTTGGPPRVQWKTGRVVLVSSPPHRARTRASHPTRGVRCLPVNTSQALRTSLQKRVKRSETENFCHFASSPALVCVLACLFDCVCFASSSQAGLQATVEVFVVPKTRDLDNEPMNLLNLSTKDQNVVAYNVINLASELLSLLDIEALEEKIYYNRGLDLMLHVAGLAPKVVRPSASASKRRRTVYSRDVSSVPLTTLLANDRTFKLFTDILFIDMFGPVPINVFTFSFKASTSDFHLLVNKFLDEGVVADFVMMTEKQSILRLLLPNGSTNSSGNSMNFEDDLNPAPAAPLPAPDAQDDNATDVEELDLNL